MEVQWPSYNLPKEIKRPREKGKTGKAKEDWKSKPVTWTPFDQALKTRIVEYVATVLLRASSLLICWKGLGPITRPDWLNFNPHQELQLANRRVMPHCYFGNPGVSRKIT